MVEPAPITDQDLSAFLDGELDDAAAARIEMRLADDPALQARLRSLTEVDDRLGAAFHVTDDDPIVQRLAARIREPARASKGSGTLADLAHWRTRSLQRGLWQMAAAASIAAIVGAFGGFLITQHTSNPSGPAIGAIAMNSPLGALLEQQPAGKTIDLSSDYRVAVVASFRDDRGRICRELEYGPAGDQPPSTVAFACRLPDGKWSIQGAVALARPEGSPGYQPSSSGMTDAVSGLVRSLNIGEALAAEDERRLLSTGWR